MAIPLALSKNAIAVGTNDGLGRWLGGWFSLRLTVGDGELATREDADGGEVIE